MFECNAASTPLGSQKVQRPVESCEAKPYQQLIGSLMYLAVWTRPDIMYAVSALSQFNTCYDESAWNLAERVLRYLSGTKDYSIKYSKSGSFEAYSDADWAGCEFDRRSYTGFVVFLASGPVSWEARKQKSVANSSTEAEYVAASDLAREIMFLLNSLSPLGFNVTQVPIFCDNRSVCKLVLNEGNSKGLRHIDVKFHFIEQLVEKGIIALNHVSTGQMIADIFTKPLPAQKHNFCVVGLNLE